ncbi:MAG: hypothetical protein QMD71_00145 [bacterium]|nr:hypothetical protein [bacterium]
MKGIAVKDFKNKKGVSKILEENSKFWETDIVEDVSKNKLVHIYRVYFDKEGKPIVVKTYDKKGRSLSRIGIGIEESNTPTTSKGRVVYIYRKKNKRDKLEDGIYYNFIVHNKNGKELERAEYYGEKLYKKCKRDRKGKKIELSYGYDINGTLENTCKNYYDKNENIIKQESSFKGLYGWDIGEHRIFYYDKNSRLIRTEIFSNGKLRSVEHRKYSKKGNLIEIKSKWLKESHATIYLWDEESNLIQQELIYSNSILLWKINYVYDQSKRLVKKDWFNSEGSLKIWETYEYNENNRIAKEEKLNSDHEGDRCTTYEYDEKGRKVRENWLMKFPVDPTCSEQTNVYKYDERGRLVEELWESRNNFPLK